MRIAFAGGDKFAVPTLERLAAEQDIDVAWVAAIPDRPAGRGMQVKPGPVPAACAKLGLTQYQPENDAHLLALLSQQPVEFFVTCAYGRKLGTDTLNAATKACINIHASLLPRWRGAAPIERALLANDQVTGVTTMLMAERIDAGAILLQESLPITAETTGGSLRIELAQLGADLIVETLHEYNSLTPKEQNPNEVTKAARIKKDEAQLDWQLPATELELCIRAFNPAPGAFTFLDGDRLKIHAAKVVNQSGQPGTVINADDEGIVVACGEQALSLVEIQPAGSKPMKIGAWLRGLHGMMKVGSSLGIPH